MRKRDKERERDRERPPGLRVYTKKEREKKKECSYNQHTDQGTEKAWGRGVVPGVFNFHFNRMSLYIKIKQGR